MNKTIYYIFGSLFILNVLAGIILSCYNLFNVVVSTAILLIVAALCVFISSSSMKEGFKVSLLTIFPILGLFQFGISLFMPPHFTDNGWLLSIIGTLVLEAIVMIIALQTSKHIQ